MTKISGLVLVLKLVLELILEKPGIYHLVEFYMKRIEALKDQELVIKENKLWKRYC